MPTRDGRIRFVRTVTLSESTYTYDREDLPEILRPLIDDDLTVAALSEEQQDALDELLADGDYKLGDQLDSSAWEVEPTW